jgi:integrase
LTGARYGELSAMTAGDFELTGGTIYIPRSKSGKARHIHLSDEGKRFFKNAVAGKTSGQILFLRSDGEPWKHAQQARFMKDACTAAKISPAIGFHILRHSYASRLAMRGVPMQVIAAQLGHSDTRMTEKHYAHLAPSHISMIVREQFGSLGIVPKGNIRALL